MKPIIEIPQGTDFVNALELVRQIAKALAEAGRPAEGDVAPHFINATNNNFYMMDAAIKGGKLRAFIDGNTPATRLDSKCLILVDDAREYLAGTGIELASGENSSGDIPKIEAATGITKGAVINAFEGLHFKRDKWNKYLGDSPNWLVDCRTAKGSKKASALWNPVLIAVALFDKKITIKELDAVFIKLENWAEDWKEKSASFRQ